MSDITPAFTTLITAAELAPHVNDPGWVIIDCRHDLAAPAAGRLAYAAGHVPGARFAALDTDLSDKSLADDGSFRGRHPLPARSAFVETLRRWGIDDTTQVVAYDAQGGMFAARLWWMLRWVGHEGVAVLDGGLQAWTAAGQSVAAGDAAAAGAGNITERAALVTTVTAAEIQADIQTDIQARASAAPGQQDQDRNAGQDQARGRGRRVVIDARAADRFRGENETLDPVGGHIPGAKNRVFKDNLQADGHFKPAHELRAAFEMLVPAPSAAIMQCGSGVTACHNLLAMEIAGLPGAALYPGSWSEWCADPARPVATGPA